MTKVRCSHLFTLYSRDPWHFLYFIALVLCPLGRSIPSLSQAKLKGSPNQPNPSWKYTILSCPGNLLFAGWPYRHNLARWISRRFYQFHAMSLLPRHTSTWTLGVDVQERQTKSFRKMDCPLFCASFNFLSVQPSSRLNYSSSFRFVVGCKVLRSLEFIRSPHVLSSSSSLSSFELLSVFLLTKFPDKLDGGFLAFTVRRTFFCLHRHRHRFHFTIRYKGPSSAELNIWNNIADVGERIKGLSQDRENFPHQFFFFLWFFSWLRSVFFEFINPGIVCTKCRPVRWLSRVEIGDGNLPGFSPLSEQCWRSQFFFGWWRYVC